MRLFHRRRQRERDLETEIRAHLDEAVRDRVERGETPEEARINALREFGNVGLVMETTRETWGRASLDRLMWDVRFGLRMMRRNSGFTLVVVMTLALGIGASTAIFSVVDAALLRPLPYRAPERLVHLFEATPQKDYPQREFSYPDYLDYQRSPSFEGLAAYTGGGAILGWRGEPQRVLAPAVSADFFTVLGVEPLLGRTFRTGEDKPGAERVTVLTYGLWQRLFGGDAGVIGRTVTLGDTPHTVVGVLPSNFQFAPRPGDLWVIYQPTPNQLTRRHMHGTNLIGRLRDGITLEQARIETGVITARIADEHKESHAGTHLLLTPLREQVVGGIKPMLLALSAAVGLVLLMVCANIAGLLLARSLTRRKEMAIRASLGATRSRIVRQLLTEAGMLSLLGGLGGLLVARFGLRALIAALPQNLIRTLPFLDTLRLDTSMWAFAFVIASLTGLVFGIVPALQVSRLDLWEALKAGGHGSAGGERRRLRGALVVTEIALSVVLLVGAGLMMKSLLRLMQSDIGFNPASVLTMSVVLPVAKYTEPNRNIAYFRQLKEDLAAVPGIKGIGTADILPLQPGNTTHFVVEGEPDPPVDQRTEANLRVVSAGYFSVLGVPFLRGRDFSESDQTDARPVGVINKSLADSLLGGRDPVGRRLRFPGFPNETVEIVGVVGDVKVTGLDQAVRPVLYVPFTQNASNVVGLVVRTNDDPTAFVNVVRERCRALEPEVVIFNAQTMETRMAQTPAAFTRRFPAWLIGIFSAVALALAVIGVYGVVSYSVNRQLREFGVRMALGARVSDILRMVLSQGLSLVLIGTVLGAVAALVLTRWLNSLLYEVSARDPFTFAVVVCVMIPTALAACLIPARRAVKVDPLVVLRAE